MRTLRSLNIEQVNELQSRVYWELIHYFTRTKACRRYEALYGRIDSYRKAMK